MHTLEFPIVGHIVADLDALEDLTLLERVYPPSLRPRPRRFRDVLSSRVRRLIRRAASSVANVLH